MHHLCDLLYFYEATQKELGNGSVDHTQGCKVAWAHTADWDTPGRHSQELWACSNPKSWLTGYNFISFFKKCLFLFLRGCSDKDNEMMIHLCYFSQASKITENHRFLFYQRRLLSVINLMSSHLVKWWRFYWGVEDSTGLFYPLYTVEYHSSKRQNMKKNLKNTKKSSFCSLRGHFWIVKSFVITTILNYCKRNFQSTTLVYNHLLVKFLLGKHRPMCNKECWRPQSSPHTCF